MGRNFKPASLLIAAAAFAAVELLLTLAFGFLETGRAEAAPFLLWRPWLLIAAALILARAGWRKRILFYALALLLAGLAESLLLLRLGASRPWLELPRGLAASLLLLVPVDLLVQAGLRWQGRNGAVAAALGASALFLVPALHDAYASFLLAPAPRPREVQRPPLLLMTGLPIIWGERGAFDPASRPALAYRALGEEYDVRAIDAIDGKSLGSARLLLLAQPRWLAPSELVALDAWVRGGGRVLVLADPTLAWPSDLPLGDVRRPVPVSLLGSLLAHWGLALEAPDRPEPATLLVGGRALRVDAPGRFTLASAAYKACRLDSAGLLARCAIGKGRAILIADADLMRDDLWAAPGPGGESGARRLADNPFVLADLLDQLGGLRRERSGAPIVWADPGADRRVALLSGFSPLILAAGAGFLLARRRKRKSQAYPQGDKE